MTNSDQEQTTIHRSEVNPQTVKSVNDRPMKRDRTNLPATSDQFAFDSRGDHLFHDWHDRRCRLHPPQPVDRSPDHNINIAVQHRPDLFEVVYGSLAGLSWAYVPEHRHNNMIHRGSP